MKDTKVSIVTRRRVVHCLASLATIVDSSRKMRHAVVNVFEADVTEQMIPCGACQANMVYLKRWSCVHCCAVVRH